MLPIPSEESPSGPDCNEEAVSVWNVLVFNISPIYRLINQSIDLSSYLFDLRFEQTEITPWTEGLLQAAQLIRKAVTQHSFLIIITCIVTSGEIVFGGTQLIDVLGDIDVHDSSPVKTLGMFYSSLRVLNIWSSGWW